MPVRRGIRAKVLPDLSLGLTVSCLIRDPGLLAATLLFLASPVVAQPAVFEKGDIVVTGFSGVAPPQNPAANPSDLSVIDTNGASAEILKAPLAGPPQGQLQPATAVLKIKAADVGQVFAITLDDAAVPNIYLAASSAFGLRIVVPGGNGPRRSEIGAAGAQWMAGQFGAGGGPGSIYKVDGRTGAVSLFANLGTNSGPGIGDLVFDKASRQFFVSDLDDGLIYRLSADGAPIDKYDHGVAGLGAIGLVAVPDDGLRADITSPAFNSGDPATWGYTPKARRVWGMAVNAGRLYYAVAEGPQVWSVGIGANGFADDARLEIDGTGLPSSNAISDIAFDDAGRIYLAQRGAQQASDNDSVLAEPHKSAVIRFSRDTTGGSGWISTPETYAVGLTPEFQDADGGVDIGSSTPGAACNLLWSTGDGLMAGAQTVSGLQGSELDLVRPANAPPTQTYLIGYDGQTGDPASAGHIGDVEIWRPCAGTSVGAEPSAAPATQTYPEPPGAPEYPANGPAQYPSGGSPQYPPDGSTQYPPPGSPDHPGSGSTTGCGGDPHCGSSSSSTSPATGVSVSKQAIPADCTDPGGGFVCTYTITATNNDPVHSQTNVSIVDRDTFGANSSVAANTGPPSTPGWTCTNPSQQVTCTIPSIPAGKSASLQVTINLPPTSELNLSSSSCTVHNSAWIDGQHNETQTEAGAELPHGTAGCVPSPPSSAGTPPTPPVATLAAPFTLKKKGDEKCTLVGAGSADYLCHYSILAVATAALTAAVDIYDEPPFPDASFGTGDPNCTYGAPGGGGTLHCSMPSKTYAAGEQISIDVYVHVPPGDVKSGAPCSVPNSATLKVNGASVKSDQVTDEVPPESGCKKSVKSSASKTLPTTVPKTTGGAAGDLALERSSWSICTEFGSDGVRCPRLIKITNVGSTAFAGRVTVSTTYPGYAFNLTSTTTCFERSSSTDPYRCFIDANLAPGQSTSFTVWVDLQFNELPGSAACTVYTVSTITDPEGATLANKDPSNDEQLGTSVIRPCPFTNLKISKTPADDNSQIAPRNPYSVDATKARALFALTIIGAPLSYITDLNSSAATPDLTKSVGTPGCGQNREGEGLQCGFFIGIQNLGPGEFNGPVEFVETPTLLGGGGEPVNDLELRTYSGLDCQKRAGGSYICGTTEPIKLLSPSTPCNLDQPCPKFALARVDVIVPSALAAKGMCTVANNVRITTPDGVDAQETAVNRIPPELCGPRPVPQQSTMSNEFHCPDGELQEGIACVKNCDVGYVQVGNQCEGTPGTIFNPSSGITPPVSCDSLGEGWHRVVDARRLPSTWEKQTITINGTTIYCARAPATTADNPPPKPAPPPPPPPSNFTISKTALGCRDVGGIACAFEITVTNVGPLTYVGPVDFIDVVENRTQGTTVAKPGAPWDCDDGLWHFHCRQKSVTLAPGAGVTATVTVKPGPGFKTDMACQMPNAAYVSAPAGNTPPNSDATDDSAHATATATVGLCGQLCPAGWSQVADPDRLPASWQRQTVVVDGEAVFCAKAPSVTTSPSQIPTAPVFYCPDGTLRGPNGCPPPPPVLKKRQAPPPCPPGRTLLGNRCVPACPDGSPRTKRGICPGTGYVPDQPPVLLFCPNGQPRFLDGSCPQVGPEVPNWHRCPDGRPPNRLGQCKDTTNGPSGSQTNPNSNLSYCPDGQPRPKNGICSSVKTTPNNINPFMFKSPWPSNNGLR